MLSPERLASLNQKFPRRRPAGEFSRPKTTDADAKLVYSATAKDSRAIVQIDTPRYRGVQRFILPVFPSPPDLIDKIWEKVSRESEAEALVAQFQSRRKVIKGTKFLNPFLERIGDLFGYYRRLRG